MEKFRIDFTLSNPFPDGKRLGEVGEINAGQLIITPPENLASREEIRLYVVAFSTENGPFRYGPVPKTDTVTVPVDNNLTVGTALSVQLEGYDENGEFLIKSPVLSGIMISGSIGDCECSDGTNPDGNVIPGHYHKNLEILDSLSEKNGVLSYNNNEIYTSEGVKTTVLNASKNEFLTYADIPYQNFAMLLSFTDSDGNYFIPDGAEILSLELNFKSEKNPEWINIKDLQEEGNPLPYIVNMGKAYYSVSYGGVILATLYFPLERNKYFDFFPVFNTTGIRVKYIERNGENS